MDDVLWQSGLGFLTLGVLLALELTLQRRGFATPEADSEDAA